MKRVIITVVLSLTSLFTSASDPQKADQEKLQGSWKVEAMPSESLGAADRKTPIDRPVVLHFEGNRFRLTGSEEPNQGTFTLDPSRDLKAIDATTSSGETALGIYKLDGDRLTICWADGGGPRPDEFRGSEGFRLMTFRRAPAIASERLMDAWEEIKDLEYAQRNQLLIATKQRLERLDPRVAGLRQNLEDRKGQAREKASELLRKVDHSRAKLREEIRLAGQANELSWGNVKFGMGKAMKEVDDALEEAERYFRENPVEPKNAQDEDRNSVSGPLSPETLPEGQESPPHKADQSRRRLQAQ